jgi:hypothetical protein
MQWPGQLSFRRGPDVTNLYFWSSLLGSAGTPDLRGMQGPQGPLCKTELTGGFRRLKRLASPSKASKFAAAKFCVRMTCFGC